jgi:hypothetical protein
MSIGGLGDLGRYGTAQRESACQTVLWFLNEVSTFDQTRLFSMQQYVEG